MAAEGNAEAGISQPDTAATTPPSKQGQEKITQGDKLAGNPHDIVTGLKAGLATQRLKRRGEEEKHRRSIDTRIDTPGGSSSFKFQSDLDAKPNSVRRRGGKPR